MSDDYLEKRFDARPLNISFNEFKAYIDELQDQIRNLQRNLSLCVARIEKLEAKQ